MLTLKSSGRWRYWNAKLSGCSGGIYDNMKILYPALGLTGEAGEVANKVKKIVRDGVDNMPPDWREQIAGEIGDVLWYCAALATDLNMSLGQVAMSNKNKLSSRKERGKIGGFGDTR